MLTLSIYFLNRLCLNCQLDDINKLDLSWINKTLTCYFVLMNCYVGVLYFILRLIQFGYIQINRRQIFVSRILAFVKGAILEIISSF